MKQTQTHVWSLAGEEAVSYSLARGKAAAVTRESGKVAAYSLARAFSCTWADFSTSKNIHSEIRYRAYLFWHATAVFVRTETVIGREPPMQVKLL